MPSVADTPRREVCCRRLEQHGVSAYACEHTGSVDTSQCHVTAVRLGFKARERVNSARPCNTLLGLTLRDSSRRREPMALLAEHKQASPRPASAAAVLGYD